MMTLRCTRKLLGALRAPAAAEPAPTSTVLGDWYANLYKARPGRVVLCLNERSLLTVLVEFDAMHPEYFRDHEDYLNGFIYSTTGYRPPRELARELFQAACPGPRPNLVLMH
jgi:hypothetical protein